MRAEYISTEWKAAAFIVEIVAIQIYNNQSTYKKKNCFESQLGIHIYIQ